MRVLTAFALIGICGFAVARGWGIVNFYLAIANIHASEQPSQINAWTTVPDVASAALRVELRQKINATDSQAAEGRRETLASMLSIKPLSSVDWLALSVIRLANDQPMEQALEGLKMSVLTGPNEGNLMADRGTFGVSIWDSLSSDLKTRVATDLITADFSENTKIRAIASAEPQRVQREVRESLLASGFSAKEIHERLGF
jgi:hypothetical protein